MNTLLTGVSFHSSYHPSPRSRPAPASTHFELKLSNFLFSYYHPSLCQNIFYLASSHPSPLYFNFHRPPSHVVLRPLFSSHAHTTSTSFPGSLRFHPLQLFLLILSLDHILSGFVTSHIHRTILISARPCYMEAYVIVHRPHIKVGIR